MNGAHFHLVVNHLPIIFPLVGIIVMIVGILSKSEPVKRTAYLIFIIGAITSVIGMQSGEQAEEVAEQIAGVTKEYIHNHEEAAERFALLSYILGGMSLIGLWLSWKRHQFANVVTIITFIIAIVTLVLARSAGTTGGEIRHTEIREGAAIPMENKGKEDEH